jgi:hypothetical protein
VITNHPCNEKLSKSKILKASLSLSITITTFHITFPY